MVCSCAAVASAIIHSTFSLAVENETRTYSVEFVKSSEYAYEAAKRKMHSVKLPGMPPGLAHHDKLTFLSSLVPLDQTQMVPSTSRLHL
jgi:hypothetical protein